MKIAVAGGIGSGKSEAMKAVRELGLPCLSADDINRELLADGEYVAKLGELFPEAVTDGAVDRAALSDIVFCDDGRRARLNALAHPEIMRRIFDCGYDTFAAEIPLICESGAADRFDKIIAVTAPLSMRIAGLKKRGMSEEKALAVIEKQVPDAQIADIADVVVVNDGTVDQLKNKIKAAVSAFLSQNN